MIEWETNADRRNRHRRNIGTAVVLTITPALLLAAWWGYTLPGPWQK